MAKWKGITADELTVLRQIERINYQLRAIAKEFGTSSRLYRHYENFLTSTKKNTLAEAGLIRETKQGQLLQIRADKQAVQEIQRFTAYQKAVGRVGRFATVGQQKKRMVEAYRKRTGVKEDYEFTRAEEREAYRQEKQFEKDVYDTVNDVLYRYYELEKDVADGKEFVSHDQLRRFSKGSWTDPEDLKEMIRIANEELAKEQHEIKEEYDDYLAGL